MVATARPAIATGRSVTARLGSRENAGCQSQHQNEAQQDRINSLHSNLLLIIKLRLFGSTTRVVKFRGGPELLRSGELGFGCVSQLATESKRLARFPNGVMEGAERSTLGPEAAYRNERPLVRPCYQGEHTDRFRSYLIADISSVRICYDSKMDGRMKLETGN